MISVIANEEGRLDKVISKQLEISRSKLKSATAISVNNKAAALSYNLKVGDCVRFDLIDKIPKSITAANIPLSILYEDEKVLVVDKEQGICVHPAINHYNDTLVNAVMNHLNLKPILLPPSCTESQLLKLARPGIVHRLDKDASGVIIIAKNLATQNLLIDAFKAHKVSKTYICLVKGYPKSPTGTITFPIARSSSDRQKFAAIKSGTNPNAKPAITHYQVIRLYSGYSLLKVHIVTGRTHQIRVHLSSIGCAILGDSLYSKVDTRFAKATLMLHSRLLKVNIDGVLHSFKAKLPQRFWQVINILEKTR